MTEPPNSDNLVELPAVEFIKVLKGKEARDTKGKKYNFLKSGSIVLDKIVVKDSVEIMGFVVKHSVFIWKVKFLDKFIFGEVVFEKDVRINGGEFQAVHIDGSTFKKGLYFNGHSFAGITIWKGDFSSVALHNVTVKHNFHVVGGDFHGGLTVTKGDFGGFDLHGGTFNTVSIQSGNFTKFSLAKAIFTEDFRLYGGDFGKLSVISGVFEKQLHILGGSYGEIEFKGQSGSINELRLTCPINYFVNISNFEINHLLVESRISKGSVLDFNELEVHRLSIFNVVNYGDFIFRDIKALKSNEPGSLIHFKNSSLDNTIFFNMNFDDYRKIIIQNCKIVGISVFGQNVPYTNKKVFTEIDKKEPLRLSELYNQLHQAMRTQGNRLMEIQYYICYLDWYKIHLTDTMDNPSTLTSLYLHKISSGFGLDWFRAVLFTLVVGFLFYFLYTISLPDILIGIKHLSLKNILFFTGEYFNFLIPTHKVNFINELEPDWLGKTIDFVGRIFIGFGIYQTITSFRRMGKW